MKQSVAYLGYSIDCDCPHCGENVDVVKCESDAGDNSISSRVFTNNWDALEGWPIECPHCNTEFEIERLEY